MTLDSFDPGESSSSGSEYSDDEEDFGAKPKNFDWQVIFVLQRDNTLSTFAARLHNKHQHFSSLYNWYNYGTREHLMGSERTALPLKARIYLIGHGDTSCLQVAGKTGPQAAASLAPILQSGDHPQVLISVVACYSTAVSHYRNGDSFLARAQDNYAANLHRALGVTHGIRLRVAGRGSCLWVIDDDINPIRKVTGPAVWDRTRGIYLPSGTPGHHVQGDKIVYSWAGSTQHAYYAY